MPALGQLAVEARDGSDDLTHEKRDRDGLRRVVRHLPGQDGNDRRFLCKANSPNFLSLPIHLCNKK